MNFLTVKNFYGKKFLKIRKFLWVKEIFRVLRCLSGKNFLGKINFRAGYPYSKILEGLDIFRVNQSLSLCEKLRKTKIIKLEISEI